MSLYRVHPLQWHIVFSEAQYDRSAVRDAIHDLMPSAKVKQIKILSSTMWQLDLLEEYNDRTAREIQP